MTKLKKKLYSIKRKIQRPLETAERNRKNNLFVEEIQKLLMDKSSVAVVLGNGPSINDLDLSQLKGADLFVSNLFHRHPKYTDLNVKLYIAADPLPLDWDQSKSISVFSDFIIGAFRNKYVKKCIIHSTVYDFLSKSSKVLEEYPDVLPFTPSVFTIEDLVQDPKYFKNHLPGIRHTPMLPLLMAIQQGYSKVFISGLDHDYVKIRLNGITTVAHFYEEETREKHDLASERSLSEEFRLSAITFDHYEKIQTLAQRYGTSIINLSKRSCLDMFEKGDLYD